LLKKNGENPDSWFGDIHLRVIDEVERKYVDTRLLSAKTIERFKLLRSKRVKADYILNRQFQEQEIDKVFRLFRQFLAEVRLLLLTI
jgi:hypothetical protein